MQNLQLKALFSFSLAANPDDDVLWWSSESQAYLVSPLWKRKNWLDPLQRMMCLAFLTTAVLSNSNRTGHSEINCLFGNLKGESCREAHWWGIIHRSIFLILFSSPLQGMMFTLVTHVFLYPNLPAVLLGSIQKTAYAEPTTFHPHRLLSAPTLILKL